MKKLCAIISSACAITAVVAAPLTVNINKAPSVNAAEVNSIVNQGVSRAALTQALKAYQWALHKGDIKNPKYLTVVNYNLPSNVNRLAVINLQTGKVLDNVLVSAGKGSGDGLMATHFTDAFNSDSSVLGAIVTGTPFYGNDGYSMRLIGLENINKNIYAREVVMHSAWYATRSFAQRYGYLGHSWGCLAVSPQVVNKIINTIKGGTFVFNYAKQIDHDVNYA